MTATAMRPFDALTVPLDPGVTLVEASAGTGKTFAITRIVLRLLLEHKVAKLSEILVVTFTEKATQELVTRIRSTLREAERVWSGSCREKTDVNADLFTLRDTFGEGGRTVIQDALASLDDLAISTIHGFCHRILAESALESRIPFRTTFIDDDTEPFQRAANDWSRRRLITNKADAELVASDGESPAAWIRDLVRPYRQQANTHLAFSAGEPSQELLADFVESVDRAFEEEKERRHLLGYDDLLRILCGVLTREGSDGPLATRIRAKFGAALIDEFQDTDSTQYPIFANAFAGRPLFMIGDPKQSIFGFRGADVNAYLHAAASAKTKFTLLKNFRSTPEYVKAVEALFTRADDPFVVSEAQIDFPLVTAAKPLVVPEPLRNDDGMPMEWWWVDGTLGANGKYVAKEAALRLVIRDIASEIVQLNKRGLAFKAFAVLVRTNAEARQVKRALDGMRIPAVIGADADVLESDEGRELILLASAVAAPHDGWAVRAAMSTRLWGSDASEVADLQRGEGDWKWSTLVERFSKSRDQWLKRGVAATFGELLAERRTAERLLALPDGERRLTNVRHIIEILHEAWATEGLAPEAFGAWIAREQTVPNTPERRELRLETDAEAVQILTVHKAKGLEFDVVFCPTLWDSRAPKDGPLGVTYALVPDGKRNVLDLGSARIDERVAQKVTQDRAESLRLAYVALTRARYRCYVAWGEIGKGETSSMSALGHLMRPVSQGEDMRGVLDTLVEQSGGVMRVREVKEKGSTREPAIAVQANATPLHALPLRLASGQLDTWRNSSFSGLTAGAHEGDGRDTGDPMIVPEGVRGPSGVTGFRGFPAGAEPGDALHKILERVDFERATDPQVTGIVRRTLAARSLLGAGELAGRRVEDVVRMIGTVCSAQIPGAGFALDRIPNDACLREWKFALSVDHLSARRVADALAAHGSVHARAYAPTLRALPDDALNGYLTGVVDVAFERDGRWWILDWKSNWLGASDDDYLPARLGEAMNSAHYTLQYHLYLLALHRHLKLRQPGYDPATHWGGVAFVFLRGVTGTGENGWFRDAPTPALLNALDAAAGRRS